MEGLEHWGICWDRAEEEVEAMAVEEVVKTAAEVVVAEEDKPGREIQEHTLGYCDPGRLHLRQQAATWWTALVEVVGERM